MTRWRGFSLVELLVVLGILAVLWQGALAVSAGWRVSAQARQWSQQVMSTLGALRQRSLREGRMWGLCGSRDGHACDALWGERWLMFSDANDDGIRQPGEAVLPGQMRAPAGWQALWRGFSPMPAWTANGDASLANGTLTLCPPTGHDAALRQIVISKTGRLRLVVPATSGAAALKSARQLCGWP